MTTPDRPAPEAGGATAGPPRPPSPAEAYERHFVPAMFRPWADRLLGHADLRPGARVLDVACGTGIVARQAAPRVGPGGRWPPWT